MEFAVSADSVECHHAESIILIKLKGDLAGFEINIRDDKLGLEGTMALIEKKFGLCE